MSSHPLFVLEDIHFQYPQTVVLTGISLSLTPGRFYGIIGPNGSGKTTLLDLLTGNRTPQKGSISFLGSPLSSFKKRALAQQLALVPQEFDTGFGFTVEEIVMMGRHPHISRFSSPARHDWQLVDQAMSQIGIAPLRDRLTTSLSGGQKQRTVVARALAQNTPVLIFDEATSSLDIKYTLQIFRLVHRLVRDEQRTIIAVIHDLNLAAAYCDHLIFLNKGTIVAEGPTEEVLNTDTIHKVFDVSSEIKRDGFSGCLQIRFPYRNG